MSDRYYGWRCAPDRLCWICGDLPGWCVQGDFAPDRRGVYRRRFTALYRGLTIGETGAGTTPEMLMDAVDDLLGRREVFG